MNKPASVQYTIRGVPAQVDHALRDRARASGRSINQVALEALALGTGTEVRARRDLSFAAGSLSAAEGRKLEASVASQRRVDKKLWK
jgi:plasmid stability protein